MSMHTLPREVEIRRHTNKSRTERVEKPRAPARTRAKPNPLTPAERNAKAIVRNEKRGKRMDALKTAEVQIEAIAEAMANELGDHDADYYLREIMQQTKLIKNPREVNIWNTYLSIEATQRNDTIASTGEKRKKVAVHVPELRVKWNNMTQEEKQEYTKDGKKVLEERRKVNKYAPHNVHSNCFQDARASLTALEREMTALHKRTGTHILLFATRSEAGDFLMPRTFSTSQQLEDMFHMTFGMEVGNFAGRMESYALGGLDGLKQKALDDVLSLKSETSSLISAKLRTLLHPLVIKRMNYERFDEVYTLGHRVVIENWPLATFAAPGKFNAIGDLKILYRAWESGHTHFRRLTEAEMENREHEAFMLYIAQQRRIAQASRPTATATGSSSSGSEAVAATSSLSGTEAVAASSSLSSEAVTASSSSNTEAVAADTSPGSHGPSATVNEVPVTGPSVLAVETVLTFDGIPAPAPKRKRRDNGVKRGPNKRTKDKLARAAAAAAE